MMSLPEVFSVYPIAIPDLGVMIRHLNLMLMIKVNVTVLVA